MQPVALGTADAGRSTSRSRADCNQGSGRVVSELGPDDVVDLYVLREALEGLAARLARAPGRRAGLPRLASFTCEVAYAPWLSLT